MVVESNNPSESEISVILKVWENFKSKNVTIRIQQIRGLKSSASLSQRFINELTCWFGCLSIASDVEES